MIGSGLQTPCDIAFKLLANKGSAFFDGTNDFVNASSVASDISLTAGSISLWGRITQTLNNESFFNCSDGDSGNDKIQLWYSTSTAALKATYKKSGSVISADFSISNQDIVSAGWFHVVMTYDVSANSIKLYYNGSLAAASDSTLTAIDSSSVTLDRVRLGKNSNADNTFLTGYIDECAYFARVLSASEVARIHNEKGKFNYVEDLDLTGTANQLKQWLRFGDGNIAGTKDTAAVIFDMNNTSLGSNLSPAVDFRDDAGHFTSSPDEGEVTQSNGTLTFVEATSTGSQVQLKNRSITINKIYKIQFTVFDYVGGNFRMSVGNSITTAVESNGDFVFYIRYASGLARNYFYSSGSILKVKDISVQELNGNTAFADGATVNQNNLPG